jgi:hypothetical protein
MSKCTDAAHVNAFAIALSAIYESAEDALNQIVDKNEFGGGNFKQWTMDGIRYKNEDLVTA